MTSPLVKVASWWGPAWRAGTTDTQGVSTDAALGDLIAFLEDLEDEEEEQEAQQQPQQLEQGQQRQRPPPMRVALHLEPYPNRTALTVREDLEYLHRRFGASRALLRLGDGGGRPLFYAYDSYRVPTSDWADLLTPGGAHTVRGTELDGVFLGLVLEPRDMDEHIAAGGFEGFYTYFASEAVSAASDPRSWPGLAAWAARNGKICSLSVGPGYDDHRIRPWNAAAARAREGGARYARALEAARAARPAAVSVASFNEWGEGTQIEAAVPWVDALTGEPGLDYGGAAAATLYLDITAAHAAKLEAQLRAEQEAGGERGGGEAGGDDGQEGAEEAPPPDDADNDSAHQEL